MRLSAGKAVILALSAISLFACNQGGGSSNQSSSSAAEAQLEWTRKTERQLRDAIAQAPAHGLKPDLFLKGDLPEDDAQRFGVLTRAALRYAEALAHGYVDPHKISEIYTIPRPKADVRQGLIQAIQNGNVGEWLASLPPQTDEYRALSQAHLQFVERAVKLRSTRIPAGEAIKPGQDDPRLPAIAVALTASGYLPPPAENAAPPQNYSPALVAAVRRAQTDFGVEPDGIIGADTLTALTSGPATRARQLAVALERLRWLERNPPGTRIDVNTAATFLDYWRDGARADRRRVVVGQPDWQTPQLQSPIFQLVANPIWRVPDSIVEDELAEKSASYLAANDFARRDGRLVQLPGPKNSLGQVKFDMRNKQAIYLHDTPAKALFGMPERHRSHGCIRVEGALDFATQLAAQHGVTDKFMEALASGDETFVDLKAEIPVRLLYHTAYWDGSRLVFVPDLYGWDSDVARAIGLEGGPPRPAYQHARGDIGP